MGPENARFPLNRSPQRGLFDWLLDLLAAVVMHEVRLCLASRGVARGFSFRFGSFGLVWVAGGLHLHIYIPPPHHTNTPLIPILHKQK